MTNILANAENTRKRGKYRKAKEIYQKMLESEPDNLVALEGLIESLYGLGDKKNAQDICNRVIQIDSSLIFPHIFLAYIYDDLGDMKNSRDEANIALSLNPDSPEALCCYGILLVMNREFKDAIEYLKRSIEVDSNMYLAHYNLLVCYYNIRDYNNSYNQAKMLFKLKPNLRNIFNLFGMYLATNALLRVSIFIVPVILCWIGYKIALVIHGLMILMYIPSAIQTYKNREMQRLKLYLIMIALFILIDAMLLFS